MPMVVPEYHAEGMNCDRFYSNPAVRVLSLMAPEDEGRAVD